MTKASRVHKFQTEVMIALTIGLMLFWTFSNDPILTRYAASFVMGATVLNLSGALYGVYLGAMNGENPGSGRRD